MDIKCSTCGAILGIDTLLPRGQRLRCPLHGVAFVSYDTMDQQLAEKPEEPLEILPYMAY